MTDLIDAAGEAVADLLGCGYAGQEPQDKDGVPAEGLVIVERIGGGMDGYGIGDHPWIQFTVLAQSKKEAWDQIRRVRQFWAQPRVKLGDYSLLGIQEVLNPEDASLTADPFYRVRVTFEFHVRGLA